MIRSRTASSPPRAACVLACAAVLATSPGALAQTSAEKAMAQALFDEARGLMKEERFAEACPKLAESQRLDPGGGTLLNLAVCHERQGKTASAWTAFREALGLARKDDRPEREKLARERIAALEPRLSRLTVRVAPGAEVEGLQVTVAGAPLGEASWGTATPTDPGPVTIGATAPGRAPWQTTIDVGAAGDSKEVVVPALAVEAAAAMPAAVAAPGVPFPLQPSPPPVAPPPPPAWPRDDGDGGAGTRRIIGLVAGGVGLASIGVGAAFGVVALGKQGDADALCPGAVCSPDQARAVALNDEARTAATVSNVAIGVGLAGVAAGTVLVLTSIGGRSASAGRAPAAGSAGLFVGPISGARGSF